MGEMPELAGRYILGDVIGLAPSPGSVCDADAPSVMPMPDGTIVCRCVVCPRCGQHTGNSHQGHNWGFCKVTKTVRAPHFCCGNEFGCELETTMGEMLLNGREPLDWELPESVIKRNEPAGEYARELLAGLIASEKDLPHNPSAASWLTDIATDML